MSKLFFFRHGQASFGADNYDVLSDKGTKQSKALGQYLIENQIFFDKIFVGPLNRQIDTYKEVREVYSKHEHSIPEYRKVIGLKEHQGIDAMKIALPEIIKSDSYLQSLSESSKNHPEKTMRNTMLGFQYFLGQWAEGKIVVEGIPSWASFREEVREGLNYILKNVGKGETVGIFSSGGTISAITAECLNLPNEKSVAELNFSIRNTSFTSFLYSNKQLNLLSFNELPHLSSSMITFV